MGGQGRDKVGQGPAREQQDHFNGKFGNWMGTGTFFTAGGCRSLPVLLNSFAYCALVPTCLPPHSLAPVPCTSPANQPSNQRYPTDRNATSPSTSTTSTRSWPPTRTPPTWPPFPRRSAAASRTVGRITTRVRRCTGGWARMTASRTLSCWTWRGGWRRARDRWAHPGGGEGAQIIININNIIII